MFASIKKLQIQYKLLLKIKLSATDSNDINSR